MKIGRSGIPGNEFWERIKTICDLKKLFWLLEYCKRIKAFALNVVDPGLILISAYDPLVLPGVILETKTGVSPEHQWVRPNKPKL